MEGGAARSLNGCALHVANRLDVQPSDTLDELNAGAESLDLAERGDERISGKPVKWRAIQGVAAGSPRLTRAAARALRAHQRCVY